MIRSLLPSCYAALALTACTVFDHQLAPKPMPDCATNGECSDRIGAPALCVQQPLGHCVQLTSEDCTIVTGDYTDDKAVVIASLLSTTGAQATTNIPRQQSAILAVEEINESNASGGILESSTPGDTRKLVMVSCDEIANLPRVATHLITDLHLPAIVGPNLSQDTLDLTIGNPSIGLPSSAQAGTLLITPAAVANAIATVPDNGLTWLMVPSDVQRLPLMKAQINDLETQLKTARSKTTIKLGIFYRDDALGKGTSDGLTSLMINGNSLSQQISMGNVRVDSYDPALAANSPLVASYVTFAPDIIVVVGTAEVVKYFVNPLEAAWTAPDRPYYVAIDSTKVPDLITAVSGADPFALRVRFRGTGVTTTPESAPVFNAFQIEYGQRWKDMNGNPQPATISNMGPSYDAVFAVALALVGSPTVDGASIATGLPRLSTSSAACTSDSTGVLAPCFAVTDYARTLYNNMRSLLGGVAVSEIGTFGRLEWDSNGAKSNGVIEMWCINGAGPKPVFASSGLTYDVKSQMMSGSYTQCPP